MIFCRLATSAIAVSAAVEIWSIGSEFELTLIQTSFVSGCLIITPAKSVFLSLSSSCWIMYNAPISEPLMDKLASFLSELIT